MLSLKETLQVSPMKKKTPKTTTPTSTQTFNINPDLPIIKIVSEEEEMHVKMELEMEDTTHDMLVKWGKEVATDEDYVRIAIDAGIREAVDALNNKR
jgi:hypothetical protein